MKKSTKPIVDLKVNSFHITFPHQLKHKDGKDGKEEKLCWFECVEHMQKYIQRHQLKPKDYEISKTKPKET